METDPTKPLLRLVAEDNGGREPGTRGAPRRPDPYGVADQNRRFGPRLQRLARVLERGPAAQLQLRQDPAAIAPESLLVFEVRGSIQRFAQAARHVPGLEFIDEEELPGDDDDATPVAYLFVPDATALGQILSLWTRWVAGQPMQRGFTPWRDVFALLRDLRRWGPDDRVSPEEQSILADQIEGRRDNELVRIELELVYRASDDAGTTARRELEAAIRAAGGAVISSFRLPDIAYHAVLADLPVTAIRQIIARSRDGLAGLEPVMHIRPQSLATSIQVEETAAEVVRQQPEPEGAPILVILDGVPVANHPLLNGRLNVEDLHDLDGTTLAQHRIHGTAMASLIVHGDRNRNEAALPRTVLSIPIMEGNADGESIPADRLAVDVIYTSIRALREGREAIGQNVIIVNLSVCNERRSFHGQISAWARLLDRFAWQYGILFVVSAGNYRERFTIPPYRTSAEIERAAVRQRADQFLAAVERQKSERRLLSPAETVNGITIGAANQDAVPGRERILPAGSVYPYQEFDMANPSSRLGPGFSDAVKPDVLFPGAREHYRIWRSGGDVIEVGPVNPARAAGIRVAAPPVGGNPRQEGFTNGTSAAAALASRTAHRIHDALEETYGNDFLVLSATQRALILKALTCHQALWPDTTREFVVGVTGPADNRQHVEQRDNVRRYLGYGLVNADDAVACAADRATFWATGTLGREASMIVRVPVPQCMSGQARLHYLSATLAWFTPVLPGRRAYRAVRLSLMEPTELERLRVDPARSQPDHNQSRRGTLISRRWIGERAPAVSADMTCEIAVQREKETSRIDEQDIPFALAVTVAMPDIAQVYDQVRQRLAARAALRTRPVRA